MYPPGHAQDLPSKGGSRPQLSRRRQNPCLYPMPKNAISSIVQQAVLIEAEASVGWCCYCAGPCSGHGLGERRVILV